jgi:hypothetical protein
MEREELFVSFHGYDFSGLRTRRLLRAEERMKDKFFHFSGKVTLVSLLAALRRRASGLPDRRK